MVAIGKNKILILLLLHTFYNIWKLKWYYLRPERKEKKQLLEFIYMQWTVYKVKSFGNIASLWLTLASIGGTKTVATLRRGPACDVNKSIFYSPTQGE